MLTLGIDLSAADANTAACILAWDDDAAPRVESLRPARVSDSDIVELASQVDVVGIDSPFGWPTPFADAVSAYSAGEPWPAKRPSGLWLRRTDERALITAGGRAPLSVSSDRIARPAERAARLLTLLGRDGRAAARDGSDGVVEVYPAGALRCWSVQATGYKRPDGIGARASIVATMTDALGLTMAPEDQAALVATDHATDALVASFVARAWALDRVVRPQGDEILSAQTEGWLFLPTGRLADLPNR